MMTTFKFFNIRLLLFSIIFGSLLSFYNAHASVLKFIAPDENLFAGDVVNVMVMVDSEGSVLNAGDITVLYDQESFEALAAERGSSVFTLWTKEPAITDGSVNFQGGVPFGFSGTNQLIGTILFRAAAIGTTTLTFDRGSRLLLHDGLGTGDLVTSTPAEFIVESLPEGLPKLSSRTHEMSGRWYREDHFVVSWDVIEGIDYSYLITQDPFQKADIVDDIPVGDVKFSGLTEGTWYFTLRQKKEGEEWSPAVRYLVLNDTSPPEPFTARVTRDPLAFNGEYFLSASAIDSYSGVNYFEVQEGDSPFTKVTPPYVLKDQSFKYDVTVRAVDRAGNVQVSRIAPPPKAVSPLLQRATLISLLLLVILTVGGIVIYRRLYKRNDQG